MYEFAGARWYDPLRALWTWLLCRRAEAEVNRLVADVARPGSRVLDLGCGTGFNLGRLRALKVPFATYVGVDMSPAMLAIARARYADETRATFLEREVYQLENLGGRFDVILCTWVASHLERPRDALDLAYGALGAGGHAILLIVTRPASRFAGLAVPVLALFRSRPVDPAVLEGLPGRRAVHRYVGGLVTLVHLCRNA